MDFPTINPYSQILPGIQTGMQLAGMFPKKQNVPPNPLAMSDPGEYKPVDTTKDLEEDLMTYARLAKNKVIKKLEPDAQKRVIENYAKAGVFKTPLINKLVTTLDTSPDELVDVFKTIKTGSPEAMGNVQMLLELSGNDPEVDKLIKERLAQAKTAEDENKQIYLLKVRKVLDYIDDYNEHPKDWVDKYGQMNEQTKKVLNNWGKYLETYARLDPQGAKQWLDDQRAKRSGGSYAPILMQGIDKRTGKMITARANDEKDFLRQYPDADPNKIFLASKMGEATPMVAEAEVEAKKYQKILEKLPKGDGKKLNPKKNPNYKSVIEQYLKAANGDPKEAERMAKDNNWIIE